MALPSKLADYAHRAVIYGLAGVSIWTIVNATSLTLHMRKTQQLADENRVKAMDEGKPNN